MRMTPARNALLSAISTPWSNLSANAPAGSAKRSHGRLSTATTADTASGCGLIATARSGTAPKMSPSPELENVKPTHRRANDRCNRCRCHATRLEFSSRPLTRRVTRLSHRSPPYRLLSGRWRDSGGGRPCDMKIAKGDHPPCRYHQGSTPYRVGGTK